MFLRILAFLLIFMAGCATVAQKQVWSPRGGKNQKGKWVNVERYICRGSGCKAEFDTGGKVEGGTFVPNLPKLEYNK